MFHALLAAELVDNAGWDLLVELTDEADEDEAKRASTTRLHEEVEHLISSRRAVENFSVHEVLGESVQMPEAPELGDGLQASGHAGLQRGPPRGSLGHSHADEKHPREHRRNARCSRKVKNRP
jgi:hypothetical protein